MLKTIVIYINWRFFYFFIFLEKKWRFAFESLRAKPSIFMLLRQSLHVHEVFLIFYSIL